MSVLSELLETLLQDPEISLGIMLVAAGLFLKLFLGGLGDLLHKRRS